MTQARRRGRPPSPDILTPAEWQIANAVRHGLGNRDIAARRGVSVEAVKYHISNVLQKLGYSTRKDLRRWNGIARDSALFGQETDMTETMAMASLGQVARPVRDIAAARVWYGEVLGLKHLYSFGDLAFFDCGGVRLFLSQTDKMADKAEANESILYFRVGDIHARCAELEGRGVVFINAPHMIHRHENGTEEWMAFFKDNDDRPLALMAQVSPA